MKPEVIIQEVEAELGRIGIRVRRERGRFRGGWCLVNDERCVMLNRHQPVEIQLSILAECLRSLPVESIYLRPATRAALEELWESDPVAVEGQEEDDVQ